MVARPAAGCGIIEPNRLSSMRLLLVEDDAKTASFILKGLKECGYAVDHAGDGETGLHMALSEPYDTAIVDVMLPKLDGLTLIGELRRKKNKLPVIILSARGSTDDRVKGLETGSDDYLTKPFINDEIRVMLRRALNQRHLSRENRHLKRELRDIIVRPSAGDCDTRKHR